MCRCRSRRPRLIYRTQRWFLRLENVLVKSLHIVQVQVDVDYISEVAKQCGGDQSTFVFPLHFPEKMKLFSWLSCILVAVAVAAHGSPDPTELKIETTFKPDSCPHQAKKKDYIHVHYVSRWGYRNTCIA